MLSRELELSRIEIDGRFDRAERVAHKAGAGQQLSRIKYERAWTACYWFSLMGAARISFFSACGSASETWSGENAAFADRSARCFQCRRMGRLLCGPSLIAPPMSELDERNTDNVKILELGYGSFA